MARSKYRNVRTTVDGITFASKAEAKRYGELKLLEWAGAICDLQRQPRFVMTIGGETICTYVGDFSYSDGPSWSARRIIEDVKGLPTPEFKIKWALAKALYPGIDWRLIPAKSTRATSAGSRRAAA